MANKIFEYTPETASDYVNVINSYHQEESDHANAVYYTGIVTAIRNNFTEVHTSKKGTTYSGEDTYITLAVTDGNNDHVIHSIDYRKAKQHIELYCEKTKHLVRLLPSPVRDGFAIISLYTVAGCAAKRITKNTIMRYEIVAKIEDITSSHIFGGFLYEYLIDPESANMDNEQLANGTRLTRNYH